MPNQRSVRSAVIAVVVANFMGGCSAADHASNTAALIPHQTMHRTHPNTGPAGTIQHVVIIIQENRTFDNMFNGFPGADTVQVGLNHLGQQVPLTAIPLNGVGDWQHSLKECRIAYDGGKMDGFDLDTVIGTAKPPSNYTYARPSDLTTYWAMASAYTLADRMFASNCGSSFPAHQYLIAGQTGLEFTPTKKPWGCDSTPPHCFNYQTLGDLLDTAGVSWKYYAHGTDINTPLSFSGFLAYDAINHIRYGSDWTVDHIG